MTITISKIAAHASNTALQAVTDRDGLITPRKLDAIINGVLFRVYERPDHTIYATMYDFDRFGLTPIETFRVKFTAATTPEDVSRIVARNVAAIERRRDTAAVRRLYSLHHESERGM
jgi:hypothetical protein